MKRYFTFCLMAAFCLFSRAQEKYADIDGQKFRCKILGSGNITVIFESGMSDSLETWGSIPDTIALSAKVFLYDRADIGKSDTSRQKRTIPNMVQELKSLLNHEKINPPFILVGHSLGGYITRYFCSTYPEDIKGLLLLDPSPEAYWEGMSNEDLANYIKGGTEWYRTRFKPRYRKEWVEFIPNMVYMHDLKIQKELPVILVSATQTNWYRYQKRQISGFNNARQVELKGIHHIYKDYPTETIGYIRELIKNSAKVNQ
ncbi:MAG: alpha/beta fold hydrolase [Methanosarcina sp.]